MCESILLWEQVLGRERRRHLEVCWIVWFYGVLSMKRGDHRMDQAGGGWSKNKKRENERGGREVGFFVRWRFQIMHLRYVSGGGRGVDVAAMFLFRRHFALRTMGVY